MNNKGFTLTEIIVSLIVSAILILTMGAISGISTQSSQKNFKKAKLYNDISYSLKLMQNRVRAAKTVTQESWKTQQKSGQKLVLSILDNNNVSHSEAFGVYENAKTSSIDLVHLADNNKENEQQIILSVPKSGILNFSIEQITSELVKIKIDGKTASIPFDLSSNITRRNL